MLICNYILTFYTKKFIMIDNQLPKRFLWTLMICDFVQTVQILLSGSSLLEILTPLGVCFVNLSGLSAERLQLIKQ